MTKATDALTPSRVGSLCVIGLIFLVLGTFLVIVAQYRTFVNPTDALFIVGFCLLMTFPIYVVNVLTYFYIECGRIKYMILNTFTLVFAVIGGVLVGISASHSFIASNLSFDVGFAFLMGMLATALITMCLIIYDIRASYRELKG